MDSNRQLAHETNTQGRQKKNLHFPLKYPVGIIHIYSKRAPICKQWYSKIQETPGQLVPREIFERLDGQQMRHQLSEFLLSSQTTLLFFHFAVPSFQALLQNRASCKEPCSLFLQVTKGFLTALFAATVKEFAPSPASQKRPPTPGLQLGESQQQPNEPKPGWNAWLKSSYTCFNYIYRRWHWQ